MDARIGSPALLALIVSLFAACGSPPAPEPVPVNPALTPGEHVVKTADGIDMPYVVSGEGDVTVLLIHCWMCDQSFWSAQVPELAPRYRTIQVNLPGHGAAGGGRANWTVAAYGEDVARLIDELDLSRVVLVGHSMGGPVSLKAAALAKGRVLGIVAVDTLHDAEFEFAGKQVEAIIQAFETDYAGTCSGFIDQMFPEEGVNAIKARVLDLSCDSDRSAVGIALMKDFGTINMEGWMSEADVPIRAVNAAAPNATKINTNRKYADFDAVTIPGVGHYPQMTRPAEFNPLLLAAIAQILEASPSTTKPS